jgi:MoaA/NifB/PqqE/SkfB family radical SAM enzyme
MSTMISPEGKVRLCSSSTEAMGDLREESLRSIWREGGVEEVRKKMAAGEWPHACRGCRRNEEQGLPSKRQKFYRKQKELHGEAACLQALHQEVPEIRHLDLSFSNICNLSCVTCSGSYSTGWFHHQRQAVAEGLNYQGPLEGMELRKLPQERIDEILKDHLSSLQTIVIKGGEPLADPQCVEFLAKVAASEHRRADLSLFIQTNGTLMKPETAEILGRLNASVGFSMDGVGDVFRWTRGGDFEAVLKNLYFLGRTPGIDRIFLDYTVSAYNVFHLAAFARFALDLRAKSDLRLKCTFMGWANQDHLSPRILPREQRERALEELLHVVAESPDFFEGVDVLEKVLKGPRLSEASMEKFMKWKDFCNRMRGFRIETLCPELLSLNGRKDLC